MSTFICTECGRNFASMKALTSHKNFHKPEFIEKFKKRSPIRSEQQKLQNIRRRLNAQKKYSDNPAICKCCSKPLVYKQRHNKFCSSSCSAKTNNVGRIRTEESKQKVSKILSIINPKKNRNRPKSYYPRKHDAVQQVIVKFATKK